MARRRLANAIKRTGNGGGRASLLDGFAGENRGQFRQQPRHRQPHDVGERTVEVFHNEMALLLDRVGAGLVERLRASKIVADLFGVQRAKGDQRAYRKQPLPMGAEVKQTVAADDLVGPALQRGLIKELSRLFGPASGPAKALIPAANAASYRQWNKRRSILVSKSAPSDVLCSILRMLP